MPELRLHMITEADHAAWYPLWRGYQTFYETDIPDSVSEVTWARMLSPAEPVHGALARLDGVAVGLAHWLTHRTTWAIGDHCYLNDLYVAEAARRHGIGRRLIELVCAHAEQLGCVQVNWLTHQTNTRAQSLYNVAAMRSGFIHYGRKLR